MKHIDEEKIAVPIGTALDRFIKRHQTAFPHSSGELSQLLRDIALAGKIVNREINRVINPDHDVVHAHDAGDQEVVPRS